MATKKRQESNTGRNLGPPPNSRDNHTTEERFNGSGSGKCEAIISDIFSYQYVHSMLLFIVGTAISVSDDGQFKNTDEMKDMLRMVGMFILSIKNFKKGKMCVVGVRHKTEHVLH
jgi:hypothetical protein